MADKEQPNTLFHDLGQHLANAYQSFIDSKSQNDNENVASPEDINAGKLSSLSDVRPQSPTPSTMTPQSVPQQVSMAAQTAPVQQDTQQAPITQPQQPQEDFSKGQGGLPGPIQASTNLAKAEQNAGNAISDIRGKGLDSENSLIKTTYDNFQNNQAQDQQLMKAYMDKTIDPNHVINSMSTGKKIMTSLGLLFSGIGSGLTGQKNLALEMINDNISRDLEAQKSELGKAYNAYQMHREGTKDEFQADLQHQKDNMIAIDAAIEQQKAKLMGPQAVAAATATQLGLRNQIMDLNQKSAMWNATKQALSGSGSQDPASKLRIMQLTGQINPNQAEQAYKELDHAQNFETQKSNILQSFDSANKENTISGRITHLGAEPASVAALQNQIMPFLKDAEGRINETEIKRTDKLIPSPGDSQHKIAEKRKALEDFMNEKSSTSTLKSLGIEPNKPVQKPQYKTVNGIRYMRGPNGEAIPVK